ncbi:MAG: V-type ATP synthase subunit D [Methanoregulaceae archaeon]|nr:V-type ATP synthase subunit D [Methanoregulaceae archaeon]
MKIRLTQGELKRQRDSLRQYERYLPTLQLKKQQLQLEILHQQRSRTERENSLAAWEETAKEWLGLLIEAPEIGQWIVPESIIATRKNIAGVDVPVFIRVDFVPAEYDLFTTPLWVDTALERLKERVSLGEELSILEQGINILRHELRITTQRVNLFEKIKIPEAKEAIRVIKIAMGDRMTSAVGRSKIAKNKVEEDHREVAV